MESDLIPYTCCSSISAQAVLVLAPHPDDEVFGCGGAVASHVQAHTHVCVVILTDGALFGNAATRTNESIAAAKVLGYGEPEFWNIADRELRYGEELVQRIADKIETLKVDLVYAPSPWEIHPDHRQTSHLAVEALRRVHRPVRLAFYEVGAPLRPNVLLDISTFVDAKDAAMLCFASQLNQQDYLRHIRALNQYRTYTLSRSVLAAEAFWILGADELNSVSAACLRVSVSPGVLPELVNAPTKMPLVSILIRSTDRKFLADALDSVALQTYPHIEVVVVSARPEHKPLPNKCGAFSIRLIQTDTPLPRSKAANVALAHAHGDFLLFLDDDDWLMPGHIARLTRVLMRQPHALATYTGITTVTESGNPLGQSFDWPFDATRLMAGNLMPIHAVLFSAKVLSHGCRFDEQIDQYEDWDFWLQLAKLAPMVHLPGVSGAYRIHDSSGVHVNAGPGSIAAGLIYKKWDSSWTLEKMGTMMQRAWRFPELTTSIFELETQLQMAKELAEKVKQDTDTSLQIARQLAEKEKLDSETKLKKTQDLAEKEKLDFKLQIQMLQLRLEEAKSLASLASENTSLIEQKSSFRIVQLENMITAIQYSQSWRMTKPWRWLSGKLKLRYLFQKNKL